MSIGIVYSQRLKNRCIQLKSAVAFVERIESEMRYTMDSCEKIIERISKDDRYKNLNFIYEFLNDFNSFTSFEQRFKQAINKEQERMSLNESDIELIKEFSSNMGTTDIEGQINNCHMYAKLLKSALNEAEEERNEKSRLYCSLSVMAAAAFSVIII